VADISSAAARSVGGYDTVVISGSSTAPSLSDETSFPHVARTSTSDGVVQAALAKIVAHFEWRRIVVIHDRTTWGGEAAAAFTGWLQQEMPGCETVAAAFSYAGFSAGQLNVTDILDEIARVQGRIVYLAMQSTMAGAVFAAFHTRIEGGRHPWFERRGDFAWLLAYVDAQLIVYPVSF
jgi:ABC-type branched-subunit amino acid transport system substrate-binding protein